MVLVAIRPSMGHRYDKVGAKLKHTKSDASGGKVSHLESMLPQRFNPRSSGQITAAFSRGLCIYS